MDLVATFDVHQNADQGRYSGSKSALGDDCLQYLRCRVLILIQRLLGPTPVADGIDGRTTHCILRLLNNISAP